jgi:hypothetical protein
VKRVESLEREESVRGRDQRGVVIPAKPGAALVVVQAEFTLALLVVEFDLPAQAGEAGERLGLGVGR